MTGAVVSVTVTLPPLLTLAEVGAAVRTVRKSLGLSLRDAAEQIGTSFNTLSRLERDAADCAYSTVLAVLRWLDSQEGSHVA
jgi:predicted transcriptional regulator